MECQIRNKSKYKKLYKEYCDFMDRIANLDFFDGGINAHCEYVEWIDRNEIPEDWINLMEEDIEKDENLGG